MTIGLLLEFLRNADTQPQFEEIESILSEAFENLSMLNMKKRAAIAYDVMILFDNAGLRGESVDFTDSQHMIYFHYFQEMYEHRIELLEALKKVS